MTTKIIQYIDRALDPSQESISPSTIKNKNENNIFLRNVCIAYEGGEFLP